MVTKKVLLVGNFGVGKTSLIRRFVNNEFSEDYISTIGVRVSTKEIEIKSDSLKLLIWDVAGMQKDETIPKAYFLGASAAMFVFDLSREETYLEIHKYVEDVKKLSGLKKITVVANKKDLLDDAQLSVVMSKVKIKVDFVTSAKEGENVEDAFKLLGTQSLQ